jgi:hypothetical protein
MLLSCIVQTQRTSRMQEVYLRVGMCISTLQLSMKQKPHTTICFLKEVGYQVCFVSVVESRDRKLKLIGQLEGEHAQRGHLETYSNNAYPYESIQVNSFIAVGLNLNMPSQDIHCGLPL